MSELLTPRGFQPMDYWRIIVRRRWIIVLFCVLVIGTTLILTRQQKKEYMATTIMHLDMASLRVVDFDDTSGTPPRMNEYLSFYNTQLRIINSRSVKSAALTKLRAMGFTEWDSAPDPVSALGAHMQTAPMKDTRLVELSYVHEDPQKAASIANAIADAYIEENLNRKLNAMRNANELLNARAEEYKALMLKSDKALLEYKTQNDLLSMEQKETIFARSLSEIYQTYNNARAERITQESEYQSLLKMFEQNQYDALVSYFSTDTLRQLKQQLNDVDRQYQSLSDRYKPKFPQMVQLDLERQALQKKIVEELSRLIKGKEAEYKLKVSKEKSLQDELNRTKTDTAELEMRMVKARELLSEFQTNERLFRQLDEREGEVSVISKLIDQTSNIEVIDRAVAPTSPFRPNLLSNLFLALVVSLSGGLGLAFVLEFLDRTFKSQDDVEPYLNVPLLGVVPLFEVVDTKRSPDTFVFYNPKSPVAECCRSIRTKIFLGGGEKRIHSLLVTSALPQEGKSTIVVSLGITMAMANNRTLIIDTDLRRPRLHKVFGRTLERGFTSIVSGKATYEEAIYATEIPNLFILPSGPIPSNPAEILLSPKMDQIIAELKERFDLVIFDSPPTNAVTDAVILSTKTDGVVFVIKQDATTKDAALSARRRLSEVSDNLLGCVMNSYDPKLDSYGYHYYYYYHYYGDETLMREDKDVG